jgi:hypothetical protein
MTDTTTLTATTAFAAAVRAALSDLPPDDLDELTDGLEADLAERAADADGAELGDPVLYAEELRAAAGYPPRSARSHLGDTLPNLRTLPQELRRRWDSLLVTRPLVRSVVDFFAALRPVWWVLRGIAVHALLASFLGFSGTQFWPVAIALVVLSVQVGRGRMPRPGWAVWLTRVVSAIVLLASPFMLDRAMTAANEAMYPVYADVVSYPSGLTSNGMPVDNVFAYDASGEPIDQVQLFDQNGDPLDLTGDTTMPWWDAQDGSMLVPSDDVAGRAGWNVYPLAHVNSWSDFEDDGALDDSEITPSRFPVTSVKPLAGHEATGGPMTEEAIPGS